MLRERESRSLKSTAIFFALNKLTGHSKPIDREHLSSYRVADIRRPVFGSSSKPKKASNYQPPPLAVSLPRRKGAITPPSLDYEERDHTRSPLFKLPREILFLIYEQVIGDTILHIVRRSNGLAHAMCCNNSSGSQEDCRDFKCRGTKLPNGVCMPNGRSHTGILPLLQTCRKIYIDAVQVLYISNTFDFDCMESLISFSTCILPHRFDSIQNLQLDLRFNYSHFFGEGTPTTDFLRWERMWRIIGSMKNLQYLRVRIIWWRTDLTGAEEARYLSELLQVGKLKVFEISLPELKWKDPKEKELEAMFEVVRRPARK
ncbi:uncharacterized protein PAC_07120 [Phialocephala subalpina]|uniref:DUF7730 domain-containing protein n=1 Tax=Phialocephala subalpina TaxID=576137 RepID=A0A1L7WWU3_9HELO|nr:uncharacterized protein PAC_07120 [Phialocephala subalpina]